MDFRLDARGLPPNLTPEESKQIEEERRILEAQVFDYDTIASGRLADPSELTRNISVTYHSHGNFYYRVEDTGRMDDGGIVTLCREGFTSQQIRKMPYNPELSGSKPPDL